MNNILTIGLVAWNGEKYIRYCLDSVLDQTFQDYKLLVLDNGSTDKTVQIVEQEYLAKFGDKIKLIKSEKNLGFAKGHNNLINESDTKYYMCLNQDIILEKEYLNRTLEVFQQQTNVGVVSGKIYKWAFGQEIQKTKYIDTLGIEIFKNSRAIESHVGELDNGQFTSDIEVFGVSGALPIFLKIALEDVKYDNQYFDETFFSYKEDLDLAYRLRWAGYSAFTAVKAIAYHDRTAVSVKKMKFVELSQSRKGKSDLVNYHSYKNHLLVTYKNISFGLLLRYGFFIKIFELKKLFYLIIYERKTLKAWKEIWQIKNFIWKKRKYIMENRKITNKEMLKWFV